MTESSATASATASRVLRSPPDGRRDTHVAGRNARPAARALPAPAARTALLLAGCLWAAVLAGCSSLEPAPGNDVLLQEVKAKDSTDRQLHLPEGGSKPYPYTLAIAPVQIRLVAVQPEEEGAEPEGGEAAPGAPTGGGSEGAEPESSALPRPHHHVDGFAGAFPPPPTPRPLDGPTVALRTDAPLPPGAVRYRRPLQRQLLFAPRDVNAPAPADAARVARPVTAAKDVERGDYVCPRCLNPVSRTDTSCPWCGLAFSPEPPPGAPATAAAAATGEGATGAGEQQAAAPDAGQAAERYVCYFCGATIAPTDTVCPNCGVVLGVEPGYEGMLAGAEGGEGIEGREIGKIGVGKVVRLDQSRAQFGVDPEEIQSDLKQLIEGYELFDQVAAMSNKDVDLERLPPEQQIDALLDYAADNYINYVLVPVLRRNEVRYVGTNGWWWGSLALWVAAWIPSFWVAGEDFTAQVEMEVQLWDVRARQPVAGWPTRYRGKRTDKVNQLQRKLNLVWLGWDFLGVPLGVAQIPDSGWKKLSEAMSPHAFWEMKRELIENGFYKTFVAQRLPYAPPVDRQSIALLVGVNKLRAGETRQLPDLLYPIRDVNTVEDVLRNVTGWDDDPRGSAERAAAEKRDDDGVRGRVFSYIPNAPSADRDATLANVRRWLEVDLQTLGPDDSALLYFSGFGAAIPATVARRQAAGDARATAAIGQRNWNDDYEKYVLLYDTDPDNIPRTALNVKEIIHAVKRCRARRILVVFDCSFARHETSTIARARTWELTAIDNEEQLSVLTNDFLDEFTQRESPKQCVVFAAAGIQGVAWESPFSRPPDHGVLTAAMLEGLTGQADIETGDNNGAVELHELQDFISQRFRQFSTASSLDMSFYVAGDPTRMSFTLKPPPNKNASGK